MKKSLETEDLIQLKRSDHLERLIDKAAEVASVVKPRK
jgi:hypothetical protein